MRQDGRMTELAAVRILVDRAIERLRAEPDDHPMRQMDRAELRRRLAEAAFRELRNLRREVADEATRPE